MFKEILLSEKSSELIRINKNKLFEIIPELKICYGFNQHNDYHQYDVFEHIIHVVDEVEKYYPLRVAALFHDIGKPNSFTLDEKGIGHFYGHWDESIKIFDKYKDKLDLSELEIKLIRNLIFYHDLGITEENMHTFKDVFGDDIKLLISLKKADVLAQNPKYSYRLKELDEYKNLFGKMKKI